ncbi:hypothetical protein ACFE04_008291 [Oxalis oulophora]
MKVCSETQKLHCPVLSSNTLHRYQNVFCLSEQECAKAPHPDVDGVSFSLFAFCTADKRFCTTPFSLNHKSARMGAENMDFVPPSSSLNHKSARMGAENMGTMIATN